MQDLRDLSDEIDYKLNPDTEALGLDRIFDAMTIEEWEVTELDEDRQDR